MFQSGKSSGSLKSANSAVWEASIFRTDLGWIGVAGRQGVLCRLTLGHANEHAARRALHLAYAGEIRDRHWSPDLRQRLEIYASGAVVDLSDIPRHLEARTPFQARVLELTIAVPFGATVTYGELAEQAGFPRAARAVGTVMSSNVIPLVIPCHRVVGAQGGLGGYSAPQGVRLKHRLLALEAMAVGNPLPSRAVRMAAP